MSTAAPGGSQPAAGGAVNPPAASGAVTDEALHKAEQYIEAEEGAANKLKGWLGTFVVAVAFVMSAFHLYTAYAIVPTQTLRPIHVAFVLCLCFLVFPLAKRFRHRVMWWDWLAVVLSIAIVVYLIQGGDDFTDRNTSPAPWDIALGIGLIVLVLEAMRRTNGWIMPLSLICMSSASASRPSTTTATSARSGATCSARGKSRFNFFRPCSPFAGGAIFSSTLRPRS